MKADNVIKDKSSEFAVRIVNLFKILTKERKEFVMSNQMMRSGTSIGANVCESEQAQSKPDFQSKLNIALKEASETHYWLRLLHLTEYLDEKEFQSIDDDCLEIIRILTSIIKKMKDE